MPQYWQGYGLVSEWMSRCVDRVDDLLKLLPQILQSKLLSCNATQNGGLVMISSITPILTEKQGDNNTQKRCELQEAVKSVCVCTRNYLRVHSFVLFQTDSVSERFAADFARKRPGATVRSAHVNLQPMWSGKHLVERK